MNRVYLDVCCLNRPFDDQRQARVRMESEAVLLVLQTVQSGLLEMASSEAVEAENAKNPDALRRQEVMDLLELSTSHVQISKRELARAERLSDAGLGAFDALHIACAESADADVLLTTDDRLERAAMRMTDLQLRVANPVVWVREKLR